MGYKPSCQGLRYCLLRAAADTAASCSSRVIQGYLRAMKGRTGSCCSGHPGIFAWCPSMPSATPPGERVDSALCTARRVCLVDHWHCPLCATVKPAGLLLKRL